MGNILENIGKIHIAVVKDKETGDGELGQTLGEFVAEMAERAERAKTDAAAS